MSPLWKNIFRLGSPKSSLVNFLATGTVFEGLSSRDRHFLADYLHVRHYDQGESIFEEGDIGSGFYLIRSGHVRLSLEPPDAESVELARLETGDFFGETALSEAAPRLTTAVAMESSELVGLFRSDLQQLAQNRPVLCNKILLSLNQVLSRRIRSMETLHRDSIVPSKSKG